MKKLKPKILRQPAEIDPESSRWLVAVFVWEWDELEDGGNWETRKNTMRMFKRGDLPGEWRSRICALSRGEIYRMGRETGG